MDTIRENEVEEEIVCSINPHTHYQQKQNHLFQGREVAREIERLVERERLGEK